MTKKLFLIEAPGKLKKLRQILGSEYIVKASGGHSINQRKSSNLVLLPNLVAYSGKPEVRWSPSLAMANIGKI
jgi:DNA topoisomerase IA